MPDHPTIRDIAREAGVSISAVSHAFNRPDEISSDLRERILRIARERGYRPDPRARGLRRGESTLVALVVSNLANAYYAAIAHAAQRTLAGGGYHLVILDSDGTREGECRALDAVRHERMAGAIVDAYHLDASTAQRLAGERSIVYITDPQAPCPLPRVCVDNFTAAHTATLYLAAQGRRRIAHISGPLHVPSAVQRRAGYRRALQDSGLGPGIEVQGDFLFPAGRRAMADLLDRAAPPDAVFAANDLMALGALALLRERGLRVPDDVAVVGFDNIEEATWSVPSLTTVDQPTVQIGTAAASLLLDTLSAQGSVDAVDIACTFVKRASA